MKTFLPTDSLLLSSKFLPQISGSSGFVGKVFASEQEIEKPSINNAHLDPRFQDQLDRVGDENKGSLNCYTGTKV